jgi:hypothetical protein
MGSKEANGEGKHSKAAGAASQAAAVQVAAQHQRLGSWVALVIVDDDVADAR